MIQNLILDTNIWIKMLLQIDPYDKLLEILLDKKTEHRVVIDSYGAAECMHSLINIIKDLHATPTEYERAFWAILDKMDCLLDFQIPISKDLLKVAKNKTEYMMLAETYRLETKDVPFIVLAYKHKAKLLTEDKRSLIDKRKELLEKLKIEILTVEEFNAL